MKNNLKTIFSISILSSILIFNGCSTNHEIVNISNAHAYSSNFGVIQDYTVDERIQEEIMAQNNPIEVETYSSNPNWTTELTQDPDAFTAENYVEKPPVITYKYKFDSKFYDKAIWRSNQ